MKDQGLTTDIYAASFRLRLVMVKNMLSVTLMRAVRMDT